MFQKIGRIKYLSYVILANIIFAIPLKVLYEMGFEVEPGSSILDRWTNYAWAYFFYAIVISVIVEKRFKDIGWGKETGLIAILYTSLIFGLEFWSFFSLTSDDPTWHSLKVNVTRLLIGLPIGLYLLFMPSKESRSNQKKEKEEAKIILRLTNERDELLKEKEIQRLGQEIIALRKSNSIRTDTPISSETLRELITVSDLNLIYKNLFGFNITEHKYNLRISDGEKEDWDNLLKCYGNNKNAELRRFNNGEISGVAVVIGYKPLNYIILNNISLNT